MILTLLLAAYILVVLALAAYGLHAGALLLLFGRSRIGTRRAACPGKPSSSDQALPKVTVQIPVYNERYVVKRAIQAAVNLDYPRDLLEIQILDDSTDDTYHVAVRSVELARAKGFNIELLHREDRTGYKAGALADGMKKAHGELIAVFDADFVPPTHFLRHLIVNQRRFDDPDVGFVQTRWSYLNRDANALTRAQALLLDKHFFIEQPARSYNGLLFNFNGSGGVWRRACLDDAGGWEHDTLTEDLDLSYRAEMKGWRGVYLESEIAPNDLPMTVLAFKRQQRRWARGSAQCFRKLGRSILRAALSPGQKLAALMHLSGYFFQFFLLLFILLWPQVLLRGMFHGQAQATVPVWIHGLGPICLTVMTSLLVAHQIQGRRIAQFLRDLPVAVMLTIGVTFSNAVAVLLGLFYRPSGEFERTPKQLGPRSPTGVADAYALRPDWTSFAELGLACYGFGTFALLLQNGHSWGAFPMLFYGSAYAVIGLRQWASLFSRRSTRLPLQEPSIVKPAIEWDDA